MAKSFNSQIKLNKNNCRNYVEKATLSLVQEYLLKKGFRKTLKSLNHEEGIFGGLEERRVALARALQINSLLKENKELEGQGGPFHSILEVTIKAFLSTRNNTKGQKKTQTYSSQTQTSEPSVSSVGIQCEVISEVDVTYGEEDFESDHSSHSHPGKVPSQFKGLSSRSSGCGSRAHSQSLRSPHREDINQGAMSDSPSSPSSFAVEPLSPPSLSSFDSTFHITKSNRSTTKSPNLISPTSEEPKISLNSHPSVLQSKQDLLAGISLTKSENSKRNAVHSPPEEGDGSEVIQKVQGQSNINMNKYCCDDGLELCDIEDEDFGYSDHFEEKNNPLIFIRSAPKRGGALHNSKLDLKTWRQLKLAVLGEKGLLHEGWISQGFVFSPNVPFGFVQNKGGPCGVLAVVQALTLKNLLFGSDYCDSSVLPLKEFLNYLENSSDPSRATQPSAYHKAILSKRSEALIAALVEILWRCRSSRSLSLSQNEGEESAQEVKICLKAHEPGSEVIHIQSLEELEGFIRENIHRFDCIGLVYSAALSRGIQKIGSDMDFENSSLLGQHGYCSQELINLLLFGKCISNAFDNQIALDDKILKGIESQSEIGLLSLFEHYGSCEVGSYFKNPKYPIWLVCSESHFSVLFTHNLWTISREKEKAILNDGFDLFYYDGLAKQEDIIRLTIKFEGACEDVGGFLSIPNHFLLPTNKKEAGDCQDHLIPPLEKCIKTKWKKATVSWNNTEPIL